MKKIEILDERTWKAKKELYDNMMVLRALLSNNPTDLESKFVEIMLVIQEALPYYASDGVFKAYHDWKVYYYRSNYDSIVGVKKFALIFIEIRKDMGYPHTKITHDDFLCIYFHDYKK